MGEQKDKCPDCDGYGRKGYSEDNEGELHIRLCPTCHGTGEKKLDRPDREKIAEYLYHFRQADNVLWEGSVSKDYYREKADQIIALFPDIEEARQKMFDAGYQKCLEDDVSQVEEAKREERERMIEWGNKPCHEHEHGRRVDTVPRKSCPECWQALKEGK